MNLFQFVVVKLTVFLVIGIVFGYYLDPDPIKVMILLLAFLCVLGMLHYYNITRPAYFFGSWVMVTTIILGAATISLHSAFTYKAQLTKSGDEAAHLWRLKIREVLKPSAYYQKYVARVETLDSIKTAGLVLFRISHKSIQDRIQVDDELIVWAKAEEIDPPKNPHQFNYKKYLQGQGIFHQIELRSTNFQKTASSTVSFIGIIANTREKALKRLRNLSFEQEELSIVQALLLGHRDDIDKATYDNYKNAGAIHLLAISGLHVGIVLLFLQYLLKPLEALPKGRNIKLIISVMILWGFALLAGFSASVIRAVCMFSFVAYALYLNRPGSSFNIVALSMFFILLLIDPLLLFQPGFQLSYAAVFSILWIYPKLIWAWSPRQFFLRKTWQLFSVGLSAQLGVLPLSLYYFHQFPGLFFISNMIIVPFLGIILGFGFLIVVLDLFTTLPDILVLLYNELIKTMNGIVAWIADQETFLFKDIYFDEMLLLLTVFFLISLIRTLDRFEPKRIQTLLCSIIAMQFWNICVLINTLNKENVGLMHTVGSSVLFYKKGADLRVFTDHPDRAKWLVNRYNVAERVRTVSYDSLKNIYQFAEKKLFILNRASLCQEPSSKTEIVILSKSPKINLDRYLQEHQPELIIADGSNYKSYVVRWKRSCDLRGIPFHNTDQHGALNLELR